MIVKLFFFYYHQRFLPIHHLYKNNINDFLKGKNEKNITPSTLSAEELYDIVSQYKNIIFGFYFGKQKFHS